jgi:hypothetical protein
MPTDDGPDDDGPNLDLDVPRRRATNRDADLWVSSGAGPLVVIVLGGSNRGVESDKGLEDVGGTSPRRASPPVDRHGGPQGSRVPVLFPRPASAELSESTRHATAG